MINLTEQNRPPVPANDYLDDSWIQKKVCIAEIQTLLDNGYEVEIESLDGYVPVNSFIYKGIYDEYILIIENREPIRCNANHLFETSEGWIPAKDLFDKKKNVLFLTNTGYEQGEVIYTENKIPIVDINVNHPNHRYNTNGVSSHNTGIGKSLAMCHFAASYLSQGKNVLYITLEMAEEKIAQRIDANLLDINIQDFVKISKSDFDSKIQKISRRTQGKLIVKEYPPTTAHSGHFRTLFNELKLKRSFTPDVVIIDYINICASSRFKVNGQVNTYSLIKSIAEEIRSLAVEFNLPIITATQTNRCLGLDTIVNKSNGVSIQIKDIKVGDEILSHSGYVTVKNVFEIEKQEVYEITTKSGKKIRCSDKHIFPTIAGEKSILNGLSVGDVLFVKTNYCDTNQDSLTPLYVKLQDEIVSIKKIGAQETIDIEVSGDNLFFANDILTHNSGYSSSDLSLTDTSECIYVDEQVELRDGTLKKISDVCVGEQIKSQDDYKTVVMVHHKKQKDCIKISTKSGKSIIVSKDHVFPTKNGRVSYNSGLKVGDFLNTME